MAKAKIRTLSFRCWIDSNKLTKGDLMDRIIRNLNKSYLKIKKVEVSISDTCFEEANNYNIIIYFDGANKEEFFKAAIYLTNLLTELILMLKNSDMVKGFFFDGGWSNTL